MIYTDRYHFMAIDGSEKIPSRELVRQNAYKKIITCVQFDSNICLDLVQFIEERKKIDQKNLVRIQHLLTTLKESDCDVHFVFPLYELSLNRKSLTVDKEKAQSLADKIWEAIHLNIEDIYSYNFLSKEVRAPEDKTSANLQPFAPLFKILYASFLKIHLLAKKGLSENMAYSNLKEFLRWTDEELDVLSTFPLQAALAIFGGSSNSRKLIGVDRKDKPPADLAWGATCDAWLIMMYHLGTVGRLLPVQQETIFVTNDKACFSVFSNNIPRGIIYDGGKIPFTMNEISYEYSHFHKNASQVNDLMRKISQRRAFEFYKKDISPMSKFDKIIEQLEKDLALVS